MLKNYLKIALRNLINQKVYSGINVFGLAIGLSACILVGLFIKQELDYESYYKNADNIYRIADETIAPSEKRIQVSTPGNIKTTLEGKFPELLEVSRVYFSDDDLVKYETSKFYEDEIIYADSTFFKVFPHNILLGKEEDFLKRVNTIVITKTMSEKYFGNTSPLGKALRLNDKHDFEVVGVIEDVPLNSHFTFDFVATYKSLYDTEAGGYIEQWGATFGSYTYLLTTKNANPQELEEKITSEILLHLEMSEGFTKKYYLQPIKEIHLHSNLVDEIEPNSSITYVIVLSLIASFILMLACINFVNLTTARAVKRAKEIGIRKVLGAIKYQLIKQFLGESILISFVALITAFVFVELMKPGFNNLIGTEVTINYLSDITIIGLIIATTAIIGVLAGLYPSFVLTHFQPVKVLKGGTHFSGGGKGSGYLRKGLVLFQFSISIILIVVTLMLNKQVDYMRSFDMGFEKTQTIILETPERMRGKYETIKTELNSVSGVIQSAACLGVPVYDSGFTTNLRPKVENGGEKFGIAVKMIDDDYSEVFGINLVSGRSLAELTGADFTKVMIANEALVKKLGYSDPNEVIGKIYNIGLNDFNLEIVGVMRDFHYKSLRDEVKPLVFMRWGGLFQELAIKIGPNNITTTLAGIESVWKKFYPEYPFVYSFLDEKVDKLYKAEERSFNVITTFSLLAIFIACLGLLGLTFFTAEQKRKEIGVRKVLGASVAGIVQSVSFEFIKLVIIANLIAWPVSYYLMNMWLEGFAYRTSFDLFVFIESGLIALSIAFVTISYTVLRSALANPVKSLRYE